MRQHCRKLSIGFEKQLAAMIEEAVADLEDRLKSSSI